MELSQLRTFRVVAETLNFTRAAERLHLTQSAVSYQIKALEQELGEPLFIRSKRGFSPTYGVGACNMRRSISATERTPHSTIVRSSSRRISCNAMVMPASPNAPRPYT